MKIVNTFPYFSPFIGGAEMNAYRLSKELVELGNEVEVHCGLHDKNLKRQEVLDSIKVFRHKIILSLKSSPFFLFKSRGDIYHSHYPFPFNVYTAYMNKKLYGRPFILTYYNDLVGNFVERIYNNTLSNATVNMADSIIVPTPIYIKNSQTLKKYKKKINVIPIGIDKNIYHPRISGKRIRKKHEIKDKMVLFVGALSLYHKYKGVDFLIKAMKDVVGEHKKTKLVVVGEGEWKKDLIKLAKKLKIEKNIIFTGFIPEKEKPEYFAACDVFILPSTNKSEGFGIVSLEAMACGKPVIGSDVGGIPFVVGDAGILSKPKDVKSISNALLKVLGNEKLARRMGTKSRKRVEKHFAIRKLAEKTERLFESFL